MQRHEIKRFGADEMAGARAFFEQHGYVVLSNGFDVQQGLSFWEKLEHAMSAEAPLTFALHGDFYVNPEVPLEGFKLPRIVDVENHVPEAVDLMLHPNVTEFIRLVNDGEPTCLQTLTYKFSSEQGAHSDKSLVAPPYASDYDRETLIAAWFAMEQADESNGALIVYPGSHKVEKRSIDDGFDDDYGAFVQHCIEVSEAAGCLPVVFEAKPGDILFWHGDLVHAGGEIIDKEQQPTRKSLVCHYASLPEAKGSLQPEWQRIATRGGSYFRKIPLRAAPDRGQPELNANQLKPVAMNEAELNGLIAKFDRWHQIIEFAPGIKTPGVYDPRSIMQMMDLPADLSGKTVLDVGACDGFYTLEAHKRGAEVVAVDYKDKALTGFPILERVVGKQFVHLNCNIYDLAARVRGQFDVILFLGVLYHLPDPLRALHILRNLCKGELHLETYAEHFGEGPAARYYPRSSLANDSTNFFAPNPLCVKAWLEDAGFVVKSMLPFGDRLLVKAVPTGSTEKMDMAYGRLAAP